ncbi:hypothetical protein MUK42_22677 [Musa troglodytarum]|uniref:Uncharacterized protein n=1 Tax=Musa troglodytarum TaxID=320322 RepID=A0A9E7K535_9LILI|nr:hypothetical protein MUK42_22677 [Musa troglodytarum]
MTPDRDFMVPNACTPELSSAMQWRKSSNYSLRRRNLTGLLYSAKVAWYDLNRLLLVIDSTLASDEHKRHQRITPHEHGRRLLHLSSPWLLVKLMYCSIDTEVLEEALHVVTIRTLLITGDQKGKDMQPPAESLEKPS